MNSLRTSQNQGIGDDCIQSIGNVFNTVAAESLLAVALAATSTNGDNINLLGQVPEQQGDFQQLSSRLMIARPDNPTSCMGSVLGGQLELHQQHQEQPQDGALHIGQDQAHVRHQIPPFFGEEQNRQNPFAMFDSLQTGINSLDGSSALDSKDNPVPIPTVPNAAGHSMSLSNLRSNSTGGIQLLQQQLANLQRQVMQQQQLLQQQPNPKPCASQQPQDKQVLSLHGHLDGQSLQLTQIHQSLNRSDGLPQPWMQVTNSEQSSAQNFQQKFDRTFNPARLSFNGSLAKSPQGHNSFQSPGSVAVQATSLQGLNMMPDLQQFQQLLQSQMDQSDQRSTGPIGSLVGEQSSCDVATQSSQQPEGSSDGPSRIRDPPLKLKKPKEGTDKKKKAKTFPEKLMQAMIEYGDEEAIAWLPDGKSFVIVNPDLFCGEILRHVFKESKYASFVRKLHRWGFVRLTSGTGTDCFHHPLFQMDRSELVTEIVCAPRGDKDEKINLGPNSANEPPSLVGVEKFIRAKVVAAAVAASSEDSGMLESQR